MRIAIDIDSTLHHYWDVLSEVSIRRFGIELPYDEQLTWGVTRLRPDQFALCAAESHTDQRILASKPYPGAVEAVRRWHEEGNFVHITSHRDLSCHDATARWLEHIGLPYDDLHCSLDKVSRCVELHIDVLIDDCPGNLSEAIERGITPATIVHPWNRDLCEEEDILCADNWPELERRLDALLKGKAHSVVSGR